MKLKKNNSSTKTDIFVNEKPFHEYFKSIISQASKLSKIDEHISPVEAFIIRVGGGGISGQLSAVISSIAKALVSLDPTLKKSLKDQRLYVHDARQHERNKPGLVKRRKGTPYRKR